MHTWKVYLNALFIWLITSFLFLNILSQQFHKSLVYFSWICFSNQFFHANGLLHVTHTAFSFHEDYMLSMSQYYFNCFIASCCSSTFNLSSLFTSMAFHSSLSYCGLHIFMFFSQHFFFSSSFFMINSSFSTTISSF